MGPCHLGKMASQARGAIRRQRPWAHCTGPGAAFVLSAARLRWTVHDAFTVTMDDGRPLSFVLDPPCVVKRFVADSVRRWRWRSIEEHAPSSQPGASQWFSDVPSCRLLQQQRHELSAVKFGPYFEPIWKILRSKQDTPEANHNTRGALRSLITNRQWTQLRGFTAGFGGHDKCLTCVHRKVYGKEPAEEGRPFTDEEMVGCPIGNLYHRNWVCPERLGARLAAAPSEVLRIVASGIGLGCAALDRGIFPSPMPFVPARG